MRRWLLISLCLVLGFTAGPSALNVELVDPTSGSAIPATTGGVFADIPESPVVGQIYVITDAVDAKTCDAGEGDPPTIAICSWDGSDWQAGKYTLQQNCDEGADCGITNATAARSFKIWPGKDTIGLTAMKLEYFDNSGVLTKKCTYNDDPDALCDPDPIRIPLSGRLSIEYDDGAGGWLEWGALDNSAIGVLTPSGGLFQTEISNEAGESPGRTFAGADSEATAVVVQSTAGETKKEWWSAGALVTQIEDSGGNPIGNFVTDLPTGGKEETLNASAAVLRRLNEDGTVCGTSVRVAISSAFTNVSATDDDVPIGYLPFAWTADKVSCIYHGAAPGVAATFTLSDGDGNAMTIAGTNPTCTAKTAEPTPAAITAYALIAYETVMFDTTNTPDGDDNYTILVEGYRPCP